MVGNVRDGDAGGMTAIHAPRPQGPSIHLRFAGIGATTLAVALLSAYLLVAVRPSLLGPGTPVVPVAPTEVASPTPEARPTPKARPSPSPTARPTATPKVIWGRQ